MWGVNLKLDEFLLHYVNTILNFEYRKSLSLISILSYTIMKSIIVTSRFRTGSTLLFQLLSQDERYSCYNEPLHPHIPIWMDAGIEKHQEMNRLLSHDDIQYFSEYKDFEKETFNHLHSIRFTTEQLVLRSNSEFTALEKYLTFILGGHTDKPVILNCNRLDYRLAWIKKKFPDVLIINLRRNVSSIIDSFNKVMERAEMNNFKFLFETHLYLKNIQEWSGINLDDVGDYESIYLLKLVSDRIGDKYADFHVSFKDLCNQPHDLKERLKSEMNLNITDFSNVRYTPIDMTLKENIRYTVIEKLAQKVIDCYEPD